MNKRNIFSSTANKIDDKSLIKSINTDFAERRYTQTVKKTGFQNDSKKHENLNYQTKDFHVQKAFRAESITKFSKNYKGSTNQNNKRSKNDEIGLINSPSLISLLELKKEKPPEENVNISKSRNKNEAFNKEGKEMNFNRSRSSRTNINKDVEDAHGESLYFKKLKFDSLQTLREMSSFISGASENEIEKVEIIPQSNPMIEVIQRSRGGGEKYLLSINKDFGNIAYSDPHLYQSRLISVCSFLNQYQIELGRPTLKLFEMEEFLFKSCCSSLSRMIVSVMSSDLAFQQHLEEKKLFLHS